MKEFLLALAGVTFFVVTGAMLIGLLHLVRIVIRLAGLIP